MPTKQRATTIQRNEQIRLLREQGLTPLQISQQLGLRRSSVSQILTQLGMPVRGTVAQLSENRQANRETAGSWYAQGFSIQEIADKLPCSYGNVVHLLNECGALTSAVPPKANRGTHQALAFCFLLLRETLSISQLAERLGIAEVWVFSLLRYARQHGFVVQQRGLRHEALYRLTFETADLVSPTEYAALCGVNRSSIRDRIKSGSIEPVVSLPGGRKRLLISTIRYPPTRRMRPPSLP